jgi:hypothetical protein
MGNLKVETRDAEDLQRLSTDLYWFFSWDSVLNLFFFFSKFSISPILTVKIERMLCLAISLNEKRTVKGIQKPQNLTINAVWFQIWTISRDIPSKWGTQPDIWSLAFSDTYCVQGASPGCWLKKEKKHETALIFQLAGLQINTSRHWEDWARKTRSSHCARLRTVVKDWNCISVINRCKIILP